MYSSQDSDMIPLGNTTSYDVLIATSPQDGGHIYLPGQGKSRFSPRKRKQQEKANKECGKVCMYSCLFVISIILTVVLVAVKSYKSDNRAHTIQSPTRTQSESHSQSQSQSQKPVAEYCNSMECIVSAANLLQSMNRSADPCDDFYKYACGNWKKQHPVADSSIESNWISEGTKHILRKIREHLQEMSTENDPTPVTLARTFYNSCMDTETRDALGLEPMFLILEEVGLQRLPPLPSNATTLFPKQKFNWMSIIAKIKRRLGIDVLLGFQITSALGTGKEKIIFGEPLTASQQRSSLGTNRHKGSEDDIYLEKLLEPYKSRLLTRDESLTFGILALKNMFETIAYIYDIQLHDAKDATIQTYLLQGQLSNIQDPTSGLEEMTIRKLQTNSPLIGLQMNFAEYFNVMFEGIEGLNFNFNKDTILVDKNYIRALWGLLLITPKETLEFYLWWKVVSTLASHTNTFMESLDDDFMKETTGVEVPVARSIVCTKTVKDTMDMAVSYLTATPEFIETSEKKLQAMFSKIKHSFVDIIWSSWLRTWSQLSAVNKANAVKLFVGYPDWILNKEALEEYYQNVEINETSYLNNVVSMMEWKIKQNLKRLVTGHKEQGFTGNPLDVNALYNQHKNTITVIAGYLQFPFYGLGMTALEYGTMGYALGHELNHGFDDTDTLFENMPWSLVEKAEHMSRLSCFAKQFDDFEWDGQKVDGRLTLRENVADNGGIKTALRAYRDLAQVAPKEPKLPGLEKFTHEQLFFLAYANSRCTELTKSGRSLSLLMKHAPDYFRVLGTLINSEEFANVWQCKRGSRMNPSRKKCSLW